MTITKEKFEAIISHYRLTLVIDSDIENAFDFVEEVVNAELENVRERCDYAANEIRRLEEAARVVHNLGLDYSLDEYDDLN